MKVTGASLILALFAGVFIFAVGFEAVAPVFAILLICGCCAFSLSFDDWDDSP